MANLPVAKDEQRALPFIAAVADVKINVGGWVDAETASSNRGRVA